MQLSDMIFRHLLLRRATWCAFVMKSQALISICFPPSRSCTRLQHALFPPVKFY